MSKFLNRLDKINRGSPTAMGFGASATAEKTPPMALVGRLSGTAQATKGASALAKIGADGAIIDGMEVKGPAKEIARALKDVPWGIEVSELKSGQVAGYRKKGCDFLAFEADGALLEGLEDGDTAYLLHIQPDMDERSLHAIEDLPVDAVLLSMKSVKSSLTVQDLITVSSVRGGFGKYLLLELPIFPTTGELQALRDAGVDGLVVDATGKSVKELEEMKDRLLALPRRERNKMGKSSAVLPGSASTTRESPSRVEEENDYDDEYFYPDS